MQVPHTLAPGRLQGHFWVEVRVFYHYDLFSNLESLFLCFDQVLKLVLKLGILLLALLIDILVLLL